MTARRSLAIQGVCEGRRLALQGDSEGMFVAGKRWHKKEGLLAESLWVMG